MRTLIAVFVVCSSLIYANVQAQNKSVDLGALRSLIGDDPQNVGVTFVGDDVIPFLEGTNKGFSSWTEFKRKTDVFVVFSEETKAVLERKTKKRVVVGDSIGTYFLRSWRAQDFLTRVDVQGAKVGFIHTSGKPADPKLKREQEESETRLAEFVTSFGKKNKKVEVLLVGTMVDKAHLDTMDLSDEFKKIDRTLSYVIVPTEEMKEAFSSMTSKDIYVKNPTPEPGQEKGIMDRMRWTIVEAKGSDLGRIRGSFFLKSALKL